MSAPGFMEDIKDDQAQFEVLQEKIHREHGLDCRQYKSNYLKRRIAVRMRALGTRTYAEYMRRLDRDAGEYEKLKDRITINVTEFFRDADAFQVLESKIFPALLEKKKTELKQGGEAAEGPLLRIWSAGCASGEEPFSVALLVAEIFKPWLGRMRVEIIASDIDKICLDKAQQAVFERKAVATLKDAWRTRYFAELGDKVVASDLLRKMIRFRNHDLISDPPLPGVDLLICRNVMIYFSKELHQRLFASFYDSLNPGGYLMIGKTETMLGKARERFTCVSTRERIYQRLEVLKNSGRPVNADEVRVQPDSGNQ